MLAIMRNSDLYLTCFKSAACTISIGALYSSHYRILG